MTGERLRAERSGIGMGVRQRLAAVRMIKVAACGLERGALRVEVLVSDPVYNILFLSTGGTVRSVMAEAIVGHDCAGRFVPFSAGSRPRGAVDPLALRVLASYGYPTAGLEATTWDIYTRDGAPEMDLIITVCDTAAGEIRPEWPGNPVTAHWSIADPAVNTGANWEKEAAFVTAFRHLKRRIELLASLPIASLDELSLHRKLHAIGQVEDRRASAWR
jgi:arsenate reductase (thioredoxin)